jgi:Biotin-protein ligase, N terminal
MGMHILTLLLSLLLLVVPAHARKTIGIYVHHPVADPECADALRAVVEPSYNVVMIKHSTLLPSTLANIDCVAFPGGLGDADVFDDVLLDKKSVVQSYINNGGRYLGICMGAYFAGHYYFDILRNIDTVRYIKRPGADVHREDETISLINWNRKPYNMYFFDGCAIVGDVRRAQVFATYRNKDVMAVIQGRVGLIGCHPESFEDWYVDPRMRPYWHQGEHHKLLLDFVDKLLKK